MDKPISIPQIDELAFKSDHNTRRPLALCGNPSKLWAADTTRCGKDIKDGRLIIRVAILNSTSQDRDDFVKNTANIWTLYANIKFKFVPPSENSEIRILYADESWSYVGVDALEHGKHEETMRLEYIDGDYKHNQGTILHEFGHALGFEHEHSSPEARIQWNVPAVVARYAAINWTRGDIDDNILWVAHDAVLRSSYDLESIMGYSISQDLVISGLVSAKVATQLSRYDKEWAQEFYPFSNNWERLGNSALKSRHRTERLSSLAHEYKGHFMYQAGRKLDDCFQESGVKVFRCNRPNCRPKNRQCDACLERYERFQNEGMLTIFQPGFSVSSYL